MIKNPVKPLDAYSTEEQVVGTWIDGKPIYRVTIPFVAESIPASTVHTTSISIPANLETAIRISGAVGIDASTELHREINDGCFQMWCNTIPNKFQAFSGWSGSTRTYSGYIICEYTKTTDTAIIAIPSTTEMAASYDEGVNDA